MVSLSEAGGNMLAASKKFVVIPIFLYLLLGACSAFGWSDETHLAVSKAAGYKKWYNSTGADMTKVKAAAIESPNHWFDNYSGRDVTARMVMDQAGRYNRPEDKEGHLYGAIIHSLQDYTKDAGVQGKYANYNLAFCAHYIGDLSQPFHNIPNVDSDYHARNDATVEKVGLNKNTWIIRKKIYDIKIDSMDDVAREVVRVANISHKLGLKITTEKRDMTKDEAYTQLGHSASLLKAVLRFAKAQKPH
jgi:hypothetical protein